MSIRDDLNADQEKKDSNIDQELPVIGIFCGHFLSPFFSLLPLGHKYESDDHKGISKGSVAVMCVLSIKYFLLCASRSTAPLVDEGGSDPSSGPSPLSRSNSREQNPC